MNEDELAQARANANTIRQNFMVMSEVILDPIYEWGDGQRTALIERGWSAPVAEQIAARLMDHFIQLTLVAMQVTP